MIDGQSNGLSRTYISNSLNTDTASSYSVLMKTLFSLNHEKVQGENLYH